MKKVNSFIGVVFIMEYNGSMYGYWKEAIEVFLNQYY